jgi:hypothetical protein
MSRPHQQLPASCDQYHRERDGPSISGRSATFANVCFYEGYAVKPIVIRRFNGRVFTVALLG